MYEYHCWHCGWNFREVYNGRFTECPQCGGEARLEDD